MAFHKAVHVASSSTPYRPAEKLRPKDAEGNGTGSYGLRVRVQGIDGHPFVVMNNQDAEPPVCPSNGHVETDADGSFLDHYQEYDFRMTDGLARFEDPFMEYRSQMQKSLLNYQRHPELLRPYDPERNVLSLENYTVRPRPASVAEAGTLYLSSQPKVSHLLDKPGLDDPLLQQEQVCVPPSDITGNRTTRSRLEPDVLPLRRHGSSSPVLQATALVKMKPILDNQQEALYADNINRHGNRRYIPFLPGTGRDIDTGSIPGVEELIDKFDGKDGQRRGRAGRRNRILPEDRKRSRSVDSGLPFGLRSNDVSQVIQRPTQLQHQIKLPNYHLKGRNVSVSSITDQKERDVSTQREGDSPNSPEGTLSIVTTSLLGYKRVLSQPSKALEIEDSGNAPVKVLTSALSKSLSRVGDDTSRKATIKSDVQVTPDLLKGQKDISNQSNEETAKQILFHYLKNGSNDNDDTTKRKVNLIFEKIQTFKSRAAGNVQGNNKSPELKDLEAQKVRLECTITDMKNKLEEESERISSLTDTCKKVVVEKAKVQQELNKSQEESCKVHEMLAKTELQLQKTFKELTQEVLEREKYETEVRDMQVQLSEMHDELDGAKRTMNESELMLEEVLQLKLDFEKVLVEKEKQEELLRRRERELTALKGALKDEVAMHDKEVDRLREQHKQEIHKLQEAVQEKQKESAAAHEEKAELESACERAEERVEQLVQVMEQLHRQVKELQHQVGQLSRAIDQAKRKESQLVEQVACLEKEKKQLEEALVQGGQRQEETACVNKALSLRLEDMQRDFTKLIQEHRDVSERLEEEKVHIELMEKSKADTEEQRHLLERTIEKLQKEMTESLEASQRSMQTLQAQVEEQREKNRRELNELQKQLREKTVQVDQTQQDARRLQEKLSDLEENLRRCKDEREKVELKGRSLEQQVRNLENELEAKARPREDRSRQIKLLEDKISQLEVDLEEERTNADLLMSRLERGREQVEQVRGDLLQERAVRQDLECDKVALERQNKDLKSRVAHLEGWQKSNAEGMVCQLEERIQELEQRLEGEERDRANLQLANRRLERKVKEMMMQVDEDHHSLQDEKDQLNLRLKTLKRQLDESEEEIERLEHGKKKLQRELEEQTEANEELQKQLKALRSEIRRKSTSAPLLDDLDDDDDFEDDMSTDGDAYFRSSSSFRRGHANVS